MTGIPAWRSANTKSMGFAVAPKTYVAICTSRIQYLAGKLSAALPFLRIAAVVRTKSGNTLVVVLKTCILQSYIVERITSSMRVPIPSPAASGLYCWIRHNWTRFLTPLHLARHHLDSLQLNPLHIARRHLHPLHIDPVQNLYRHGRLRMPSRDRT